MLEATGCAHAQSSILYPPSYTLVCSPPHVPTLLHPPSTCVYHPPHVPTLQHPPSTCVYHPSHLPTLLHPPFTCVYHPPHVSTVQHLPLHVYITLTLQHLPCHLPVMCIQVIYVTSLHHHTEDSERSLMCCYIHASLRSSCQM